MKTKEIDVWVGKRILDGDDLTEEVTTYETGKNSEYKAKLIVEIPDQKIEITESQFDDIWNNKLNTTQYERRSMGLFHALKNQLGFKS